MSDPKSSHRVQVIIALIGFAGIIATGVFGVLPHFLDDDGKDRPDKASVEETGPTGLKIDPVEQAKLDKQTELARMDSILKAKEAELAKPHIGKQYQGGTVYELDASGTHGKIFHLEPNRMIWRDAELHCSRLDIDGYDDWQMPDLEEVKRLYQKGHLDREQFDYWSSSMQSGNSQWHWTLREWLGQDNIIPGLSAGTGPDAKNSVIAIRSF